MTTTKIIEVIGESQKGWADAIDNAVHEACETIQGVSGVDVLNLKGTIQDGKVVEYKANVQIAFPVKEKKRKDF